MSKENENEQEEAAEVEEKEEGELFDEDLIGVDTSVAEEDFDLDVTPSDEELEDVEIPEETAEEEVEDEESGPESEEEGGDSEEDAEEAGAEEVEEPDQDVEDEEEPDYLKIINEQAAEIAALKGQIPRAEEEQAVEEEVEEEAPSERSAPGRMVDFVGDLDIDDIAAEPETFNQVMNNVMGKAAEEATRKTLLSIPHVVQQQVTFLLEVKTAAEKFWKENEDLKPVTEMVKQAIEKEVAENPDKSYDELFASAGEKIRKTLKLTKKALTSKEDEDEGAETVLPKTTSTRKQRVEALSKIEREIDELDGFQP
jgi:hypothetical protein